MSLLPSYMSELWQCLEELTLEDMRFIDPSLVSTDPLTCHEAVLPFLAWEVGVNISGVDTHTQREVINAAMRSLLYAGTAFSLKNNVESLSDTVDVKEWFEYGGGSYNFIVEVDSSQKGLSSELVSKIESFAYKYKNARSVLESIKINLTSNGEMTHLLSATSGESTVVYPYFPEPIEVMAQQVIGAALHDVDTTIIYPQGA